MSDNYDEHYDDSDWEEHEDWDEEDEDEYEEAGWEDEDEDCDDYEYA